MSHTETHFKFSDDLILMIREVLQLCLLTGRNFGDTMRGMLVEEQDGMLVPCGVYVEEWNKLVQRLSEEAEQASLSVVRDESEN